MAAADLRRSGQPAYPAGFASGPPAIRDITVSDLREALLKGYSDFMAMPTHLAFLFLIYPILGLFFASFAFGYDVIPLIYPLISGFALVGPLAGIGLYELSRRREMGVPVHWSDAFDVLRSPATGSIVAMGIVLVVVFLAWMASAQVIWSLTMGPVRPVGLVDLVREVFTTGRGWALIILGDIAGLAFAVLVLTISVVAFPVILDRQVTVATAIQTSIRAVVANPVTMALWGVTVAIMLAIGSIPVFVGLAIVMPILGHATWHLYRTVTAP